jgi:hypothetical protein
MKLKKTITNLNQIATGYNISTLSASSNYEKLDFKSGLPSGVNLNPQWVTGIIDWR